MTRRYGLLAGLAAVSFIAAWWWRYRQNTSETGAGRRARGDLMYRESPVPTSEGIL